MEYNINDLRIRRIGRPPSKNNGTHYNGTTNANNTIDLSIRRTGRPPNKIKDSKSVEQLQKCKSSQPKTTNTINTPAEQRVLLLIQDPSIARRPRGRPIKDANEPHYKDHGDPIYKCQDCNALLWHAESVVGNTHSDSGSFSLCCSRGKAMLTNEEGNPSKRELGESSASLPKILPVTREPIHHTIPLLATRIARHEDRLNDVVNVINGLPCGHITEDVNNLIIGQMAVESKVEQIKTEFSESIEFIAALCTANVTMGDVLTSFDHELEQISAQNFSLRRAIQEPYARERTRDRTIETLTTRSPSSSVVWMKCQENHKSETCQCQCHINKNACRNV
ncbi:hypothetical protein CTI12_AA217150 [Artemisia annua]|uniref:Uncharacterized protein n=1 Tax=Artemisia annua TaxID=35608 RepID=A0A2U1NXM9_ARTAN|nr:hypothetical protein CTI12_AA217150 [Artemisia annua]